MNPGSDQLVRARYAVDARRPGPREHAEGAADHRSAFQRDRDRILHSTAFRRLALKTQVLMPDEGDHHRTRLTHTLEVAQIARSLARTLGFDEDLTEALALAHDLGHSPFGHTGEDALGASLAPWGGFDHNVQTLRVVVDLEQRYFDFDGLNLTWDTLEGLAKRNGPIADPSPLLRHYDERFGLAFDNYASGEAQIAAIADDIAYNAHDLEDGLRANLVALEDTEAVPVLAALRHSFGKDRMQVDPARVPYGLARGLIHLFVNDVIAETGRRLTDAAPSTAADVRALGSPVVALSPALAAAGEEIKAFLFTRLYRHPRLLEMRARTAAVLTDLAEGFLRDPALMPDGWGQRATASGDPAVVARLVSDYIAGMTDRYALREHRRLFDPSGDIV